MTILFAKFLGIYYFVKGLSFLINPERIRKQVESLFDNEAFLYLGGIMALIIGAIIVSVHNVWEFNWPVIITILGWWALIKGFGLMTFEEFAKAFTAISKKPDNFYRCISIIYIILGLFLLYQGVYV